MNKLVILQAVLLVSLVGCVSGKVKTDSEPQGGNSANECKGQGCSLDALPSPARPAPIGMDSIPPPRPRPVGSDRDSHGCAPSTGFLWCAKTNSCQRPWILAKKEGFIGAAGINETRKAFEVYCGN